MYSVPGLPHPNRHMTSSQGYGKLHNTYDDPAAQVFQPKLKQSFISGSSPISDIGCIQKNPEHFHRYRDTKTRPSTYPQWKSSFEASPWPVNYDQVNPLDDSHSSCHKQPFLSHFDQGPEMVPPSGSQVSLSARGSGPDRRQTMHKQSPDLEEMSRNLTGMVIREAAPNKVPEEHPQIMVCFY